MFRMEARSFGKIETFSLAKIYRRGADFSDLGSVITPLTAEAATVAAFAR